MRNCGKLELRRRFEEGKDVRFKLEKKMFSFVRKIEVANKRSFEDLRVTFRVAQ